MRPIIREFTVAGPHGDGRNPFLNQDGAFLGHGTPLLEKDSSGYWTPRPQSELERLLSIGYGIPISLDNRMGGLKATARALNKGDRCLATIALVHTAFPPLPDGDFAQQMAKADNLTKYRPDQARVPAGNPQGGQWTTDGGAGYTPLPAAELDPDHTPLRAAELVPAAYNGVYHDQVVARLVDIFRTHGSIVETQVPFTSIDGRYTAIADIVVKNPKGKDDIYIVEVKTGGQPGYTVNQRHVYTLAPVGRHIVSYSPKIKSFGYAPGAPLPPIEVDQVYASPGKPYDVTPLPPEYLKMLA